MEVCRIGEAAAGSAKSEKKMGDRELLAVVGGSSDCGYLRVGFAVRVVGCGNGTCRSWSEVECTQYVSELDIW